MDLHEFYDYIWDDEVLEIVVSTKYLEENRDYIQNFTYDLFRLYQLSGTIKPQYFKKFVEIKFTNLFAFNPGTENIKEIDDGFRNQF